MSKADRTITFRARSAFDQQLERLAKREGRSKSELITRYLDEGMRMDEHPGIIFRGGPGGRRAGVVSGPDVWEIVRVVRDVEARGEAAIKQAVELLGVNQPTVEIATGYYAAHRKEIDEWIERLDDEADRARQQWQARQAVLS